MTFHAPPALARRFTTNTARLRRAPEGGYTLERWTSIPGSGDLNAEALWFPPDELLTAVGVAEEYVGLLVPYDADPRPRWLHQTVRARPASSRPPGLGELNADLIRSFRRSADLCEFGESAADYLARTRRRSAPRADHRPPGTCEENQP